MRTVVGGAPGGWERRGVEMGRRSVRDGGAGDGSRPAPGVGGARREGERDGEREGDGDAPRDRRRGSGVAGGRRPEGLNDDLPVGGRRRAAEGGAVEGGAPKGGVVPGGLRPEPGAGGGRRGGSGSGDRGREARRDRAAGAGAANGRNRERSDDDLRAGRRAGSPAGFRLPGVPSRPVLVFTGSAPRPPPLWREPSDGRRCGGTPLETLRRGAGSGCDPGERRPLRRRRHRPEPAGKDGHGQRPMARRRRAEAEVSAWRKGAAGVRSAARRRCFRP